MAVKGLQVSIGETPTLIYAVERLEGALGAEVIISNSSNAEIFIGGPDVAVSGANQGFDLKSGTPDINLRLIEGESVWGITAAAGKTVEVLVTGE